MKIIVVHGSDTQKVQGRIATFVTEAKGRNWAVHRLAKNSQTNLPQVMSESLFDTESLVLIEEPGVITPTVIQWFASHSYLTANVVIYKYGNLSAAFTKKLNPYKTEVFDLPKNVFSLLSLIRSGSGEQAVKLIRGQLSHEPAEFIFALIAKQVRDMYWAVSEGDSLDYPQWRLAKLKAQGYALGKAKLRLMLGELAEIDYKSKTGQSNSLDLLDLFFLKYLQ